MSLDAVEAALSPSTILIVASAPQYPHGVVSVASRPGQLTTPRRSLSISLERPHTHTHVQINAKQIDPIPQLADLALQHDVPLHVDACYGGLLLPVLEKLGRHEITPWDFRCEGVASISADFHKYGWAIKGAWAVRPV